MRIRRIKGKVKRKKSKLGKIIFLTLVAMIAVILLALSPLFNIQSIQVNGGGQYKNEYLISLSGIVEGQNGFGYVGSSFSDIIGLRCGIAEKAILDNCPYIKDARVKFRLPWSISINVTERSPMAIAESMGTYVLIDSLGYVLEAISGPEVYKLPIIKGLDSDNYELGQRIKTRNTESFHLINELMAEITESDKNDSLKLQEHIVSIDITDSKNILLYLADGLRVNYGDLKNIKYMLAFTKQVYFKVFKKDEKGILDFTLGQNPNLKYE